jgi:hypothetical protein
VNEELISPRDDASYRDLDRRVTRLETQAGQGDPAL